MPRVDNEKYLTQLRELFAQSKTHGSVYLVQKRLSREGPDPDINATEKPYPLVFRASNGARSKTQRVSVSTVVKADDLENFWKEYVEVLKKGGAGLRKKEKKEKHKVKK